jgi:hypothetical protein
MLSVRHAGNMYNYSLTYQARGIYLLSRVLFMLQVEATNVTTLCVCCVLLIVDG